MGDSTAGSEKHRKTVLKIGEFFIARLAERFVEHDTSKLEEPEVSILDAVADPPRNYSGGSWSSSAATNPLAEVAALKRFLEHHYKVNRHHPEHFQNGVDGMSLIDILEMFVDWAASSLRTEDGNLYRSIQFNEGRFTIAPQLTRIFMNTALEIDQLLDQLRNEAIETRESNP